MSPTLANLFGAIVKLVPGIRAGDHLTAQRVVRPRLARVRLPEGVEDGGGVLEGIRAGPVTRRVRRKTGATAARAFGVPASSCRPSFEVVR